MSALLSTSTKIDLKAVIRCPVLPRLAIVRLITSSDAVTKRKVTGPALKQHFRDRYSIFSPLDGDYGSCSLPDDIASEKGTCLYRSSFFSPHYVESVHLQPMNLLPLNRPTSIRHSLLIFPAPVSIHLKRIILLLANSNTHRQTD